MEIENILIVVCIWDKGVKIGNTSSIVKGGEFYKIIIDRARELLNQIQQKVQNDVNQNHFQNPSNDNKSNLFLNNVNSNDITPLTSIINLQAMGLSTLEAGNGSKPTEMV